MGSEQRDYWRDGSGGGRFRRVLRRVFGDGEDPLNWALPLYRAWGIQVRIHLIFVIMILAELISSFARDSMGFWFKVMAMGSLFVLVLLHEYGHCLACRWVGGSADRILMWPLGGLAYCAPPDTWRANLVTTIGGPGVNVLLMPVLGVPLGMLAGAEAVLFNPFDPVYAFGGLHLLSGGGRPEWLQVLWWFYYTNWVLLAFNMLLPMYPMDCGRILHELLWWRIGERRARSIAVHVGLVVAVCLFIFAMTFNANSRLMALAIFGGITCWMEKRRLQFAEPEGYAGYDFSKGYASLPREDTEQRDRRQEREREKRAKQASDEQAELDRILEKIAKSGMASLSRREKHWLQTATEKRRGSG